MSVMRDDRVDPTLSPAPSCVQLFDAFLRLGLIGFGGVLPLARRMVVEQRRWMTSDEFTDLLGLCQFLPGGNILNVAAALGYRFHGAGGALAALGGLLVAPVAIALALGSIYARYNGDPRVAHLFAGLAAAAAGLVVALAVKIALPLRRRPLGIVMAALAFLAIAVLRLPFVPSLGLLFALSLVASRWRPNW
jgi:chromate transporter